MQKSKEIRWLLMGRNAMENGKIRAVKRGRGLFFGTGNGAMNAMVLGVCKYAQYYRIPKNADALKDAAAVLSHMGRKAFLSEHPEAPAYLRRNTMANQRLYTADITEDGLLEIAAFMGRSFSAPLVLRFALRKAAEHMPAAYEPLTKSRAEKQEEKSARKEARKQRFAEQKKAIGKKVARLRNRDEQDDE